MTNTQDTTLPDPTPESGSVQGKLVRSGAGKWVAGVAAGLGDYTGIDPVVFRIGFVLLSVAGGLGIMLYGLGWLLIPSAESGESVGERALRRTQGRSSTAIGLLLLVIGGAWFFSGAGFWEPDIVWAVALIAIGVILLRRESGPRSAPSPTSPSVADTLPVQRTEALSATDAGRTKRPKSYLGRLTLGAVLLLVGIAAVLENLGAFDMSPEDYFALAVAGVGAGLVVGAWRGRSRALILIGALLLPLLFVASLIDVPLEGGVGDQNHRPSSAADVRDEYRLAGGALSVDLTDVQPGPSPLETAISVGAGNIDVLIPREVEVTVRGHAGAGIVEAFGREDDGLDASVELSTGNAAGGEMILDVEVGVGSINVQRTAESRPPNGGE